MLAIATADEAGIVVTAVEASFPPASSAGLAEEDGLTVTYIVVVGGLLDFFTLTKAGVIVTNIVVVDERERREVTAGFTAVASFAGAVTVTVTGLQVASRALDGSAVFDSTADSVSTFVPADLVSTADWVSTFVPADLVSTADSVLTCVLAAEDTAGRVVAPAVAPGMSFAPSDADSLPEKRNCWSRL